MNKLSKVSFIAGSILNVIIGLSGISAAVYIYNNPFMKIDRIETKASALKQCSDMIRQNGFVSEPNSKNGYIEVTHGNLAKWETSFAKLSYVFQSCRAMEMTEFCIGENCTNSQNSPINGIFAKLEYVEPAKSK